jgi:hypothetical protein
MHQAMNESFSSSTVPARWKHLNHLVAHIGVFAGSITPEERQRLTDNRTTAANKALASWLDGVAPQDMWGVVLIGAGIRHKVAHGALSPTGAMRLKVDVHLSDLFDVILQWVAGLLDWATNDLQRADGN